MNEPFVQLGIGLSGVMTLMVGLWLASLAMRNSSIVDVFWGPAFALQAGVYFAATPDGPWERRLLVLALVVIWAARLALHVAARNAGKGEDYRYAAWRKAAGGSWWWRSLFKVFLLQGALSWFIGLPMWAAMAGGPTGLTWLDAVGAAIWAIGFFFEAVGDLQLRAWTRNPGNRGRTLRTGLWRYTRHPNYFGDAAQWWGLWLVAAAAGGWWTVMSPLLMTFLLVRVSGVGMLERTIVERRPDYADYMRTTSAFVPWFPRRRAD
jgi:steroid 5-alpha reductase family enzyme